MTLDSLFTAAETAAATPVPAISPVAPVSTPSPATNASMTNPDDKPISKSALIRQLIEAEPEIRTREIVERLSSRGVTANDVGSVRNGLRKKAAKAEGKMKPKAKPAATPSVKASKPVAANPPVSKPPVSKPTPKPATAPTDADIRVSIEVLESAMEFIQRAGGINEAQFALTMIRRIKSL